MNFNGRQLQETLQCMYDRSLHTNITQNCGGQFLERETYFCDDNVLHSAWVDFLQKRLCLYFFGGDLGTKSMLIAEYTLM